MLLPVAGFRALFIVSAVSYALFGLALYWLLLAFGKPWLAAALSVVALAVPLTRYAAAADLTDMLAMLWWTLALAALIRGMQTRDARLTLLLAISAAMLALTRPTPYLVVVPAIAAAVLQRSWAPFAASLAGAAAYAAVAVATHAYGIGEQLRWVYTHRPDSATNTSFSEWYRSALLSTLRFVVAASVRTIIPIAALIAAIYGIVRTRLLDEFIVLSAAGIACAIAIPFNPVPSAIPRVVMLPLIPVFCALGQALAAAAVPVRQPRSSAETAHQVAG
jgi:4-amino-4-deoxy-L-arabinose transferase-like glycosyltransferase